MQIAKFQGSPSFKARTIIEAPETLLSKKDKKALIKMGEKIGTEKDVIEITIGELKPNYFNPDIESYDIIKKFKIKAPTEYIMEHTESTIPYLVAGEPLSITTPKIYLEKMFKKLAQRTRM